MFKWHGISYWRKKWQNEWIEGERQGKHIQDLNNQIYRLEKEISRLNIVLRGKKE